MPPIPSPLGDATGRGVRVGVIDTGWDRTLADPRVLPGVGLVDPADDFALLATADDHDRLGHGTACADLVLRLAPEASIVPIRVFGGQLETSPATLRAGIEWAAERRIPLVNLSLGTVLEEERVPLLDACRRALAAGTLIVAAAPNNGVAAYPAIFDEVIGVDADAFDSPWHFRHRPGAAIECTASGRDLRLRWRGGTEEVMSGTSFAAPHITGIVALILQRHPGATLAQVRAMLATVAIP
ncbi:MAG: S8 family serine peptidase [Gemmatimonadetes bacterium]|nr:S8 family serine peptidase [Gemmatimonadota bacterium]